MRDYPDLNMFLSPGNEQLLVLRAQVPYFAIVSTFDPTKTEEDNVKTFRDVCKVAPASVAYDEVYGHDFGVMIFRSTPEIKKFCSKVATEHNQVGYIFQGTLIKQDGSEVELPKWVNTAECLESWIQHLHPNFKILGSWNRSMSYVQMRHAQYNQGKVQSQLPDGTLVLK